MADKRKAGRRAGGSDAAHLPLRVLRRRWATRAANAPSSDGAPPTGVSTGPVLPVRPEPSRSIGPDPLAAHQPPPPGAGPTTGERPAAEPPAWAGGHDPLQRRHAPAPLTSRRPAGVDVTAPRASGLTPLPQRRAGAPGAGAPAGPPIGEPAGDGPNGATVAAGEGTVEDINALMEYLRRDTT
jgi:hypothetical protein